MKIFNHFKRINLNNDQNNTLIKVQDFLYRNENNFFYADMIC